MTAFFWLVLAIFAARVQYYATYTRRGRYNGINTIDGTLNKTIEAPMVYRVLLPWIVRKLSRWMDKENAYEFTRAGLLWLALVSVNAVWGWEIAAVYLVFTMSAQIYDTWCYTGEAIGISTALLGNPFVALAGILIHGTSRETVLINGFVYYLATGDIPGAIFLTGCALAVFVSVRLIQGNHPLYCDRFMLRVNWELLTRKRSPFSTHFEPGIIYAPYLNLIVIALALWGAYLSGRVGWVVPVIIAANVTAGKINEYRLQISVMPWAALALLTMVV